MRHTSHSRPTASAPRARARTAESSARRSSAAESSASIDEPEAAEAGPLLERGDEAVERVEVEIRVAPAQPPHRREAVALDGGGDALGQALGERRCRRCRRAGSARRARRSGRPRPGRARGPRARRTCAGRRRRRARRRGSTPCRWRRWRPGSRPRPPGRAPPARCACAARARRAPPPPRPAAPAGARPGRRPRASRRPPRRSAAASAPACQAPAAPSRERRAQCGWTAVGSSSLTSGRMVSDAHEPRLLPAARPEEPLGEHVPAPVVRGELDLVDREEVDLAIHGHRLDRAHPVVGARRHPLLLAGHQRHARLPQAGGELVVHLAGEQPEGQPDHPRRVRQHALDGAVRLAGVGRAQQGGDGGAGGHQIKGTCP